MCLKRFLCIVFTLAILCGLLALSVGAVSPSDPMPDLPFGAKWDFWPTSEWDAENIYIDKQWLVVSYDGQYYQIPTMTWDRRKDADYVYYDFVVRGGWIYQQGIDTICLLFPKILLGSVNLDTQNSADGLICNFSYGLSTLELHSQFDYLVYDSDSLYCEYMRKDGTRSSVNPDIGNSSYWMFPVMITVEGLEPGLSDLQFTLSVRYTLDQDEVPVYDYQIGGTPGALYDSLKGLRKFLSLTYGLLDSPVVSTLMWSLSGVMVLGIFFKLVK